MGLYAYSWQKLPMRKNHGFSQVFAGFSHIASFLRTQKTTQHRSKCVSNGASHQDRATNSFWGSPDWILDGSGSMLGASWTPLGQLWGAFGRLLAPLGRSLGASWTLLGRSWASPGRSGMDLGHVLVPGTAPGLDFRGFGGVLGWVLEALRAKFRHAF